MKKISGLLTTAVILVALSLAAPVGAANEMFLDQLKKTNKCPKCDLRFANLRNANLENANLQNTNLHVLLSVGQQSEGPVLGSHRPSAGGWERSELRRLPSVQGRAG